MFFTDSCFIKKAVKRKRKKHTHIFIPFEDREPTGLKVDIAVQPPGFIVQELCESRGGRPELSVLTSLLVSVDVKLY